MLESEPIAFFFQNDFPAPVVLDSYIHVLNMCADVEDSSEGEARLEVVAVKFSSSEGQFNPSGTISVQRSGTSLLMQP